MVELRRNGDAVEKHKQNMSKKQVLSKLPTYVKIVSLRKQIRCDEETGISVPQSSHA